MNARIVLSFFMCLFALLAGCEDKTYWDNGVKISSDFERELLRIGYCKTPKICSDSEYVTLSVGRKFGSGAWMIIDVYDVDDERAILWLVQRCYKEYNDVNKMINLELHVYRHREKRGATNKADPFLVFSVSHT